MVFLIIQNFVLLNSEFSTITEREREREKEMIGRLNVYISTFIGINLTTNN